MNRLVIVGNGFDLASGIKSRYSDFVKHVLSITLKEIQQDAKEFSFPLLVKKKPSLYRPSLELIRLTTPDEPYFDDYYELVDHYRSIGSSLSLEELIAIFKELRSPVEIINILLKISLDNSPEIGWADFEGVYSNEIERILGQDDLEKLTKLIELNKHLDDFKKSFAEYLAIQQSEQDKKTPPYSHPVISECLKPCRDENALRMENQKVSKEEISKSTNDIDSQNEHSNHPDQILFLNFNYTNLLRRSIYTHRLSSESYKLKFDELMIHGSINNGIDDIMLGYGNISELIFKQIESLENSTLFENFKTFYYTYNDQYSKLKEFIDSGYFSIYIVGHSCGKSDRELLSEIFQHPRCVYVRQLAFPNGPYDFKDRSVKIAGCLNHVADLRKLMLPKDENWSRLADNQS